MKPYFKRSCKPTGDTYQMHRIPGDLRLRCHGCGIAIEEGVRFLFTKNTTLVVMRASYVKCPRCGTLQEMPQTFIDATDAFEQLREFKRHPPSEDELEPTTLVFSRNFRTMVVLSM